MSESANIPGGDGPLHVRRYRRRPVSSAATLYRRRSGGACVCASGASSPKICLQWHRSAHRPSYRLMFLILSPCIGSFFIRRSATAPPPKTITVMKIPSANPNCHQPKEKAAAPTRPNATNLVLTPSSSSTLSALVPHLILNPSIYAVKHCADGVPINPGPMRRWMVRHLPLL